MFDQRLKESLESFCDCSGGQAEANFDILQLRGFRKVGGGNEYFEVINNNALRMKRRPLTDFECHGAGVVKYLWEWSFFRPLGSSEPMGKVVDKFRGC